MTTRLGGRRARTLLTSLELLSTEETDVLAFARNDNGSITVQSRKTYESAWAANGPRYEIKAEDARVLGSLLRSEDQSHMTSRIDQIDVSSFEGREPDEVIEARLREKVGDCTELDIERAKAANLAEQRKVVELEMERDHSLDRHVTGDVPGCPACDRKVIPSATPGGWDRSDEDTVNGTTDPNTGEDLPF